jgi:outer membrane lipoprotein-sorting protein
MNQLPAGLRLYREQLRDAVEQDLARGRPFALPRPRLRFALPALVGIAAAAVAATVFVSAGTQAGSADAAILDNVVTALTPPPGTILHEQAQISIPGQGAQPFELWARADSPQAYRVIKWGHEAAWNGSSYSLYDPGSNTVTTRVAPDSTSGGSHAPADFAATLRALVQSGDAKVDGTTTINGIQAYRLTVTNSPDPFLLGTAYVATSDYYPLEIDTTTNSETIVYQTYEYLPATNANLQLLDLTAQHPSATVVDATGTSTSTTGS